MYQVNGSTAATTGKNIKNLEATNPCIRYDKVGQEKKGSDLCNTEQGGKEYGKYGKDAKGHYKHGEFKGIVLTQWFT